MKYIVWIIVILQSSIVGGQRLQDYQKNAEENNPGLQARYKEFEAAFQRTAQVNALPDPTLSISAFGQMIETRVGPQQARFSLSQMFPWFGTLKARGDATALMAEAAYQSYLEARNLLFYQVAAAYYPLVQLRDMTEIEQRNMEILNSYKRISLTNFDNGKGSMSDVLRVDILINDIQTELVLLEAMKKPLTVAFNSLLNQSPTMEITLSDSADLFWQRSEYRGDSIRYNHPRLLEMDLMLKSALATERAAQKQGLPNLGVGLDYIIVGKRTDIAAGGTPPVDDGKDAIMPMVSISLPIYRKKYKSAIKEARLMQESYAFQKQEITNSLISEYEKAVFEMEKQREFISLYEKQIRETERVLQLELSAYGNSGNEFEELLRIQQQQINYEKRKIMALAEYFLVVERLNYLLAKAE